MKTLKRGLHSPDVFTFRRCQILLSSNDGQTPRQIAARLHCSHQYVRNVIKAFEVEGLACLKPRARDSRTDRLADLMVKKEPDVAPPLRWMLSVSEVARLLRVHPNSVRRWADTNMIPSYRVGIRGDRRFKFDDVDSFLAILQRRRRARNMTY